MFFWRGSISASYSIQLEGASCWSVETFLLLFELPCFLVYWRVSRFDYTEIFLGLMREATLVILNLELLRAAATAGAGFFTTQPVFVRTFVPLDYYCLIGSLFSSSDRWTPDEFSKSVVVECF